MDNNLQNGFLVNLNNILVYKVLFFAYSPQNSKFFMKTQNYMCLGFRRIGQKTISEEVLKKQEIE